MKNIQWASVDYAHQKAGIVGPSKYTKLNIWHIIFNGAYPDFSPFTSVSQALVDLQRSES